MHLNELWDLSFEPLWHSLIRTIRRHYPSMSAEDAEDRAAEVIAQLVKYFKTEKLGLLTRDRQIKCLFAFARKTVRSVLAKAYSEHKQQEAENTYTPLQTLAREHSAEQLRAAFTSLHPKERSIIRYRGIDKLPYSDVQDLWYREYREFLSEDALKMLSLIHI